MPSRFLIALCILTFAAPIQEVSAQSYSWAAIVVNPSGVPLLCKVFAGRDHEDKNPCVYAEYHVPPSTGRDKEGTMVSLPWIGDPNRELCEPTSCIPPAKHCAHPVTPYYPKPTNETVNEVLCTSTWPKVSCEAIVRNLRNREKRNLSVQPGGDCYIHEE